MTVRHYRVTAGQFLRIPTVADPLLATTYVATTGHYRAFPHPTRTRARAHARELFQPAIRTVTVVPDSAQQWRFRNRLILPPTSKPQSTQFDARSNSRATKRSSLARHSFS
jgi:hypothetical protein